MNCLSIEDIRSILLGIAEKFHLICEKNGIPYYMLGGTMLGAVRHKGFIPWDDDMDFGIPRPFFHKFVALCEKVLEPPLNLISYHNSDYAVLGYYKIEDTSTVIEEHFKTGNNGNLGVNIDIFPLDYANENKCFFSMNSFYRKLFKLQKLLFVDHTNRRQPQKALAIVAKSLLPLSKSTIPDFINNALSERNPEDYTMLCNFLGAWGLKELIPLSVFGEPILYDFEDTQFYGVQNNDEYLKRLYNDYMLLPPEDKRGPHQVHAYSIVG